METGSEHRNLFFFNLCPLDTKLPMKCEVLVVFLRTVFHEYHDQSIKIMYSVKSYMQFFRILTLKCHFLEVYHFPAQNMQVEVWRCWVCKSNISSNTDPVFFSSSSLQSETKLHHQHICNYFYINIIYKFSFSFFYFYKCQY